MTLESDYRDVTEDQLRDMGVQTPSPLVVCQLLRAYSGRFCFDWGQATHCSKLTIKIKEGDTIKGTGSFTYGGGTLGVEVSHTVESEATYETDPCSICNPVICYQGRMFIYECERFLGFWSWTTIDEVWDPSSRGTISLNCEKSDDCGCEEEETALRLGGETSELAAGERASKLVAQGDLVRREDGGAGESSALFAKHVNEMALTPIEGAERTPYRLGFSGNDGRAVWVYDSLGQLPEFNMALLPTNRLGAFRARSVVNDRTGGRLPVLAVAPCRRGLAARLRVKVSKPGSTHSQNIGDVNVDVEHNAVTTFFAEADLGQLPAGTTGTATLEVFDETDPCFRRSVSEPFIIGPNPGAEG